MPIQKNVAGQKLALFAFIPSTNLPKTGDAANLTAYISKDYGAVTALADTSASEASSTNAKGTYWWDLTQAETNADCLQFYAKSSTSDVSVVSWLNVYTTPPNANLLAIDASGRTDTSKFAGQTITAASGVTLPSTVASTTNITAGTITTATTVGSVTGSVGSVTGAVGSVTGNVGGNVVGSVGSVSGAVGSVTGAVGSVTGNVGGNVTGSVGSVASVVSANVTKVNGTTITGSGTTPDPWGP